MLKTGDDKDAGTDANVYLQMFGEKGKSHNFSLREEGDKRRFERGRMDKFLIRTKDVGPVSYLLFSSVGKRSVEMSYRRSCNRRVIKVDDFVVRRSRRRTLDIKTRFVLDQSY